MLEIIILGNLPANVREVVCVLSHVCCFMKRNNLEFSREAYLDSFWSSKLHA